MSTIAVLKAVISLGGAIVGLLVVAERLYLVNGAQYPRFLAKDVGRCGWMTSIDGVGCRATASRLRCTPRPAIGCCAVASLISKGIPSLATPIRSLTLAVKEDHFEIG